MTIDTTIIGAVIAGLFAVVAALLPLIISRWNRARRRLNRDLSKVLPGKWVGNVVEDEPYKGETLTYQVTWDIKMQLSGFVATSPMRYRLEGEEIEETYTPHGKIVYDRFIQFEYENNDESQVNFGTEILNINDSGDEFSGKFVGFSSERSDIVTGEVRGRKVVQP